MSLTENITFIRNQITTFGRLHENSRQLVARKNAELAAIRNDSATLRGQIRALRQGLISPDAMPSVEAVRQRVEAENKLRTLNEGLEAFELQLDAFEQFAGQWLSLTERKRALPSEGLSIVNRQKLSAFEDLIKIQLREFGFSSLDPNSLSLSTDSYKPTREGFNRIRPIGER